MEDHKIVKMPEKTIVTFKIVDTSNQLEPPAIAFRAYESNTIKKVLQQYSEKSGSLMEHLRLQFNDSPITITKPDGTFNTIGDIKLKNDDVLEVKHRHGNICRYCKRTINIKLKSENGYSCSYTMDKRNGLKLVIDMFSQSSLTSTDNLKLKYQGKEFKLNKPDGSLTTPTDLKMGDGDQIDILHQRSQR